MLVFLGNYPLSYIRPTQQKKWILIGILLCNLWALTSMEGIKCMDGEKKEFDYREDSIWKGTSGIVFRQSEIRTSAKEDLTLKPIFFYKKFLDLYIEGRKKPVFSEKFEFEDWEMSKLIAFLGIFPLSEFRKKDRKRSDGFPSETSRTTLELSI